MPDGILCKDVKFLGVVKSINEERKFGMVDSPEAQQMWGQDLYAFKDVLASADAGVGDTIRFGVHVNTRGQPQVSLPVYKIDEVGFPVGVPEGANHVNIEEAVLADPLFLDKLKAEIEGRSHQQNLKKATLGGKGGKGWDDGKGGKGHGLKRPRSDDWGKGGDDWGYAKGGGKGAWGGPAWGQEAWAGEAAWPAAREVSLYVAGLPAGVQKREVAHIFRQYAGFTSVRLVVKEDHTIAFASFASHAQAQFVIDALSGYAFDEEKPTECLLLRPAQPSKRA